MNAWEFVSACYIYIFYSLLLLLIDRFMRSCSAVRVSGGKRSLRKRSERRANNSKLISRCPIIWHELRELHELLFIIKDLRRERGKIKHERHEPFKIKDLQRVAPGWFGARRGLGLNVVDLVLTRWTRSSAVGAVERGNN